MSKVSIDYMRHILSGLGDYLQNTKKVNAARQSKPSGLVSASHETPESNLSPNNDDKRIRANCDGHLAKNVECLTNRHKLLPNRRQKVVESCVDIRRINRVIR